MTIIVSITKYFFKMITQRILRMIFGDSMIQTMTYIRSIRLWENMVWRKKGLHEHNVLLVPELGSLEYITIEK